MLKEFYNIYRSFTNVLSSIVLEKPNWKTISYRLYNRTREIEEERNRLLINLIKHELKEPKEPKEKELNQRRQT